MAADEPFRRYEEIGAAFVNAAANRINGLLGGSQQKGASEADASQPTEDDPGRGDEPSERGRERRDHLIELVRTEIRSQLTSLGLATREDLADLRSRLDALESRLRDLETAEGEADPDGTES
jgi:polyhydroxyalkanoate synthesis regulator phasin